MKSLPSQRPRSHSMSFQVTVGSNCASIHALYACRSVGIGDDVRQAAERVRLAEQAHVANPAGPRADLPGLRELRPEAVAADHAVAGVAMTQARHGQVHREQQRRAATVARAPEQALHDLAIPHHVELEPEWPRRGGANLLDRADADRRQRKGHARSPRGPHALRLAAAREHARHADRRQRQRHRDRLPGEAASRCRWPTRRASPAGAT